MTKIAKKIMIIFCSFLFVCCLGVAGVVGLNTNKNVTAKAATTTANFTGEIHSTLNMGVYGANYATALKFDTALGTQGTLTGAISLEGCELTEKMTINGAAAKEYVTTLNIGIGYVSGNAQYLELWFMNYNNSITEGAILHIPEGTLLTTDMALSEVKLVLGADGIWSVYEEAPTTANFVGLDATNNMRVFGANYLTALEFDTDFGAISLIEATNLEGCELTEKMLINGVAAKHSVSLNVATNYVAGSKYKLELWFMNYNNSITEGAILHIPEGTLLTKGMALSEVKLVMGAGNQWSIYEENPPVEFDSFTNNAVDYSGLKFTDLKFTNADFGDNSNQYEGTASIKDNIYWTAYGSETKNYFTYIWGNNGDLRLMSAAASFPTAYATITIVEGTVINGYTMPACTFYVGADGNWTTENPGAPAIEFSSIVNNAAKWSGLAYTDLKFTNANFNANYVTPNQSVADDAIDAKTKIYWSPYGSTAKTYFAYVWSDNGNLRLMDSEANFPIAYSKITIEEGTKLGDNVLPEVILYVGADGNWTTTEQKPPELPKANYEGITKNLTEMGSATNVVFVLDFDKDLVAEGGLFGANGPTGCELKSKMTIGGETTTSLGLNVGISSGYVNECNGQFDKLEIWLQSYTPIAHGSVLNIPEGTVISEGLALSEVILYFNAETNAWQAEKPAPLVSGFTAVEGGSIRVDRENGGLRFETHIEKETYDSLVATYGKENLKIGTYILPEAWLTLSGKSLYDYVTAYTVDGGYYMDISTWNTDKGDFGFANSNAAGEITDGESYYKYYGTIAKVRYENYLENFIGVGYLWITDKDGVEYLYLTHDGSWSRNVYEIAKEAYRDKTNVKDNQLYGITPYFDKVIDVTTDEGESGFTYAIDEVLSARSYSYVKPTDYTVTVDKNSGLITLGNNSSTVYNVMINGVKAGVIAAGETAYADYYAVTPELFATAEEASVLSFGFAEPNRDLYTQGNDGFNSMFNGETNQYSTASNIAKVTAEFDGNSARIWFQTADLCWNSSNGDTLVLDEACLTELKAVIRDFRAQGVTNISLMSGVANTKTTKNWYIDGTWCNTADAATEINNGKTADGMVLGLVVLPNETDYNDFLALQKEYFTQLALAVGDSVTAIEVLNEMEGSNNYRYCYENEFTYSGVTYKSMPAINHIAQAAMDICKAATEGVKAAGTNIKIAMPALMTVSELKINNKITRYASKAFLEAEYAYIMGANGTKDADDYFQIINMHPYVLLSSSTSTTNYLYYENDGLTVQTPAQMKERWSKYMAEMRAVFVANGDAEKPVWITEFGLADYNGDCATSINTTKWTDYRNNKLLRKAQVYQAIYDAMTELPYIDSIFFFRLGDYGHSAHSLNECGEATYGVIDKDGNLKEFGKYLYAIVNGVNVFKDENYTQLKSLSELGTINGKTVTELAANVNNVY